MNNRVRYFLYGVAFVVFVGLGTLEPIEYGLRMMIGSTASSIVNTNRSPGDTKDLVQSSKFLKLQKENMELRKAMEVDSRLESTITAKVVSHAPHTASNRVRLNKGSSSGISKDQVVLADGVVVGMVAATSLKESVVTLLDDQTFRLEVSFGSDRGILKGSINGAIIDRVLPDAVLKRNQLVTTAGSNLVPANLPVGRVVGRLNTSEKIFQQIHFASPIDLDRLSFVQVVKL